MPQARVEIFSQKKYYPVLDLSAAGWYGAPVLYCSGLAVSGQAKPPVVITGVLITNRKEDLKNES